MDGCSDVKQVCWARYCICVRMCSVYENAVAVSVHALLYACRYLDYVSCGCVKMHMCDIVCPIMASLSCDPGPHVQSIRANQEAVIRAWLGDGGSVAVGEF